MEQASSGVACILLQGVDGDVITEVVLQGEVSSSWGWGQLAGPLDLLPCLLGLTVGRGLLGLLCLITYLLQRVRLL